jgi:ParB family chromosome partitioning protein
LKTSEAIAAQTGVSSRTIRNDGAFAEAVDAITPYIPDLPQRVMAGDVPSRKAVIEAAEEPEKAAEKMAHVSHNSGNNEWYTPPEYIEAARSVMGGIDCDPASSEIANRTVDAARYFTADDNGLTQQWEGRVWMNPPYAQPLIEQFCEALVSRLDTITEACVLVNNATETQWFHTLLNRAVCVCFIKGRVRFLDPKGNPGAPLQGQALLYFGPHTEQFARAFGRFGEVLYATR